MEIFERINLMLWGPFTVGLILLCGAYHTYRSGAIQLRLWGLLRGGGEGKSRRRAVMSALAASMGTGNLTGCAAAIAAGGAGAVFWMWVSAVPGMALAYSENKLGEEYARRYPGAKSGPMLYMSKGLGYGRMAKTYAAACVLAALVMGCMSQTGALADAVSEETGLPRFIPGLITGAAAAVIIFSSKKAADAAMSAAEALVPFMGLFYAGGCAALLIITKADIGQVFSLIVKSAFSVKAAAGGAAGITVRKAVSVGLRRGVFSNEAGMGSSVLVHAGAGFGTPEKTGAWAAFEVFLDTIVCCTLTALVLLSTCSTDLTEAFSFGFGGMGGWFVSLCIVLFAFAALLGWCCYGETALSFLTEKKEHAVFYKTAFCICAAIAGTVSTEILFGLSDIINVFLIFPNLTAITALTASEAAFSRKGEKEAQLPPLPPQRPQNL